MYFISLMETSLNGSFISLNFFPEMYTVYHADTKLYGGRVLAAVLEAVECF